MSAFFEGFALDDVALADAWYNNTATKQKLMGDEAWADYRAAIHDPATVHAMLEDYRAGLGIDVWRRWSTDLRGRSLPSGHHMAEEVPELLADALLRFLDGERPDQRQRGRA